MRAQGYRFLSPCYGSTCGSMIPGVSSKQPGRAGTFRSLACHGSFTL